MWHAGQRRRRIEGRQREDKGRESRWGGQGGGGDICQEGWLGLTLEGIEGRKKVSQAFLSTHLSVSAFSSPPFSHCIWTHSVFFFLFITSVGFLTWRHFRLPDQALYVLWSFILFSRSFHCSLSLIGTFLFHFCLFVCAF